MNKQTEVPHPKCPNCNDETKQNKKGFTRARSQRYICRECGVTYTPNPKKREYTEKERQNAIRIYYSGVSGRGVGNLLGMSKANVYNWKKTTLLWITVATFWN